MNFAGGSYRIQIDNPKVCVSQKDEHGRLCMKIIFCNTADENRCNFFCFPHYRILGGNSCHSFNCSIPLHLATNIR